MKPLQGKVIITTDFEANEKIKVGNLELYLDTSWKPEQHAIDYGIVYSLPDNYEGYLQVGDKVYGNHIFVDKENEFAKADGKSVVIVDENEVYVFIRDGKINMMPNKMLVKPIEISSVILPAWLHNPFKKMADRKATVVCLPDYEQDIEIGDTVYYSQYAAYTFKVEGEEYQCLRAYQRQALAITKGENNTAPVGIFPHLAA